MPSLSISKLPLASSVPDMTASSARYAALCAAYENKALADARECVRLAAFLLRESGDFKYLFGVYFKYFFLCVFILCVFGFFRECHSFLKSSFVSSVIRTKNSS